MGVYVARYKESPYKETPLPERRLMHCLISQRLDPTNHDIALGMTEMTPGCHSDVRGHEEGELFFCVGGKGTVVVEDERIVLEKYDAVYVPPNTVHTLEADQGENFDLAWILTPPFGGDMMVYDWWAAEQNK